MPLFCKDSPVVPSTEALGGFGVGVKSDFVSLAILCLL